ncbi:MAG TPA: ketoisovalerate oxidoreductase [Lentisphaeria bacterium]|nr:MAG: ketoisovalerate oxidoreductase [Lentisphaerae bacterium GWF2_50_93]HCE45844.1 ketoisovalerate oxidoreductase [Lentisphaeria bacterium]
MDGKKKKFTAAISINECKGCERCIRACPKKLLRLEDKLNSHGYRYVLYSGEGCVGCGSCFYACPEPGAITVIEEIEEGS